MEFPSRARAYFDRVERKLRHRYGSGYFWPKPPVFAGKRPKTVASSGARLLQIACFSTNFGRNSA
jgi:hypothetical protein